MVTCWKRSKSLSQARDKVFEIIAISIRHQGANEPHSSGMSLIIKIKIETNRTKVCPPCAACASSPRDKNSLRVSVTNGLLPFEKKPSLALYLLYFSSFSSIQFPVIKASICGRKHGSLLSGGLYRCS